MRNYCSYLTFKLKIHPLNNCYFVVYVKPNTHRRRRRDETVESRRVGGVYTNSQLVGDSFVVSSV